MRSLAAVFDRGTPDLVDTDGLPAAAVVEMEYLAGRAPRRTLPSSAPAADLHWGVHARALVVAGEAHGAQQIIRAATSAPPVDLTSPGAVQGLAAATWAISRVGPSSAAEVLRVGVDSLPDGFVLDGELPLAPKAQLVGLLLAAQGDLDGARAELDAAVRTGDARSPLWGAIARVELARVLRCAQVVDGRATADEVSAPLHAACTFFVASGCRHLERTARALLDAPAPDALTAPSLGWFVEGARWTVGLGVQAPVQIEATKGLLALRHLIEHRDRTVPSIELSHVLDGAAPRPGVDAGSPDDLFDERSRTRVTKLLRRTIDRITQVHPLLGAHLAARVETGYGCRYGAQSEVHWRW
jgi:hypothetical protein